MLRELSEKSDFTYHCHDNPHLCFLLACQHVYRPVYKFDFVCPPNLLKVIYFQTAPASIIESGNVFKVAIRILYLISLNHLEKFLGALKCKFQKESSKGIEQVSDLGYDQ